jgi:hypothetical protein
MELPCELKPDQRALYDTAVEEWRILRVAVQQVGVCVQLHQTSGSSLYPST